MAKNKFQEIVNQIQYKNWRFHVMQDDCGYCGHGGRYWLQIRWYDKDSYTGDIEPQSSRKWFLSEHMTESEVVLTALKAVLTAEEHEAREQFRFNGKRIFNPHPSMVALMQIADIQEKRNES